MYGSLNENFVVIESVRSQNLQSIILVAVVLKNGVYERIDKLHGVMILYLYVF
jgi:hypothetical protein